MTSTTEATSPEELDTRAELLTALRNMNARARLISRRGYVGLQSAEYDRRHADLDDLLTQLDGHA